MQIEEAYMRIRVLSRSHQAGIDNKQSVERRSFFILDRFARMIRELRVHIADENGPKGGIDQRCEVGVELSDGRRLRARARASLIPDAIDRALRRVATALSRDHARHIAERRRAPAQRRRYRAHRSDPLPG
jgi:ribosome-associated translation inhibitor RaiA